MKSIEAELEDARHLTVDDLADAIESIGFECTRCGACCTGHGEDDHTATVFPDEVRDLEESDAYDGEYDWRDVARPMPYGLSETANGDLEGETFEWALQTDGCGDCTFYEEDGDGVGACGAHEDRPLICRTYPFSVALAGTSQPMGEVVDSVALPAQRDAGDSAEQSRGNSPSSQPVEDEVFQDSADHSSGARRERSEGLDEANGEAVSGQSPREEAGGEKGVVRAHECEGLGRDISREDAEGLARALKQRAVRELEEAIAVRDKYEPAPPDPGEVVVHDSEGAKRADGTPLEE